MADRSQEVLLFADNGDLTVGRGTGAFVWGSWDVEYPEGAVNEVNEAISTFQGDGYVYVPDNMESLDRFDLLGKRADSVQKIVINDNTGEPDFNAGESTTEEAIDESERELQGDFFFQDSIPTSGLGLHQKPGRDFQVGDTVSVMLWGKVLKVPVRSISVVDQGDGELWQIDVGSQPIMDKASLADQNRDTTAQITKDNATMMQMVAEGKITPDQLRDGLKAGDGVEDEVSLDRVLDGQTVHITNKTYRYPNFSKTFSVREAPDPAALNAAHNLATARDIFTTMRALNKREITNPNSAIVLPKNGEFLSTNGTLETEHIKLVRNNDKVTIEQLAVPVRLGFTALSTVISEYVDPAGRKTYGSEVYVKNSTIEFSPSQIPTNESWMTFTQKPKWKIISVPEDSSDETTPKMRGVDVAGKKILLYEVTTSQELLQGIYVAACFTTPGEGRHLIVEHRDSEGNQLYGFRVRPNSSFDARIPVAAGVYAWGQLGIDAAIPYARGEERTFQVYITAPDDGEEHTLFGVFAGGRDYKAKLVDIPKLGNI